MSTSAAEYRIEGLAQHSGTTVRTIRAYQDRGLLPKPERRGRSNVYGAAHLTRLRQIADLLDRGYTLASIKELLEAWDTGRGLGGVLGLVAEVHGPWTDERTARITRAELWERFGGTPGEDGLPARERPPANATAPAEATTAPEATTPADAAAPGTAVPSTAAPGRNGLPTAGGSSARDGHPATDGLPAPERPPDTRPPADTRPPDTRLSAEDAVAEAVALGVLEPVPGRDDEFLVPSPQELSVAVELHAAGVPMTAITGHLRELRGQVEHIATRFLEFTTEHVFARYLGHPSRSDTDATEAAALVRRLRPLAQRSVDAELARAMRAFATRQLHHHLTADGPPPVGEAPRPVPLPAETVRAVQRLVGEANAAAFITAATEREVCARTLDALSTAGQPPTEVTQRG
ncbi:MerR family transcriptional regulator [Streptomyces sp. NPDC057638]|uniref:MerR family transcriptional regulator n=1 Tax=Streptomyces sp. NPDC057638 TaxID=3346190 RepID=UPI0036CE00B2